MVVAAKHNNGNNYRGNGENGGGGFHTRRVDRDYSCSTVKRSSIAKCSTRKDTAVAALLQLKLLLPTHTLLP